MVMIWKLFHKVEFGNIEGYDEIGKRKNLLA
jgi:hypothetical protein